MSAREPLSALESAFVGLESRDVPFVHAAILEVDRPIPLAPLRTHVEAALAAVPRYHQRITRRRLGAPAWVDDDEYRIENQIDVARVREPGGPRELDELVAGLLASELPVDHPPWHVWTVSGLADGRGALVALTHHALVDGIAGFRLLEYVLRPTPQAAEATTTPRPVRLTVRRRFASWKSIAALRRLASRQSITALARLLRDGLRPASQIGLNPRHTGAARAVASHTVELAAVEKIEEAFGATNNDVVLATVAGALRRFLDRHGIDPARRRDVRAMVPVGRHVTGERTTSGNRVVLMLAPLPVHLADPIECLRGVSRATRQLKAGHTASGGDLLVALGEATTPRVLVGVLRLALRLRAFNVLVTNIPGPIRALSLLGAQLTRVVPIVNLWPHQALGIAVASYAGKLTFGLQADRAVLPGLAELRDDLAASFEALLRAATR